MFWFRNLTSLWQQNTLNFDNTQFKYAIAMFKSVFYISRICQWEYLRFSNSMESISVHQPYVEYFATCWGCKDVSAFSIGPTFCPLFPILCPGRPTLPDGLLCLLASGWCWLHLSSVSSCQQLCPYGDRFSGSDSSRIPKGFSSRAAKKRG